MLSFEMAKRVFKNKIECVEEHRATMRTITNLEADLNTKDQGIKIRS